MPVVRSSVVHPEASALVGIPFREGGRDFRIAVGGTDCGGICWEFCRRAGIDARDPWAIIAEQWREPDRSIGVEAGLVVGGWERCDDVERLVGDIGESASGDHVAVYVGGGYALHARRGSTSSLLPISRAPLARWWRWSR